MPPKLSTLLQYLEAQGISASQVDQLPAFLDPKNELAGHSFDAFPLAKQSESALDLKNTQAESMSLASMAVVQIIDARNGDRVLDVCSAPGMKGLFINKLVPDIEYCANDLSGDRLARLVRLFDKHGIKPANITKYDARFIDRAYPLDVQEPQALDQFGNGKEKRTEPYENTVKGVSHLSKHKMVKEASRVSGSATQQAGWREATGFDRILIDAPCSGEGVILGGNTKLLDAWSTAKVKRLQHLQIKILKSSWKLLRPGGRLVYATCTLNKNENERVIKKALGIDVKVAESELDTTKLNVLKHGQAWRILPSINSIGFFIAVLEKGAAVE